MTWTPTIIGIICHDGTALCLPCASLVGAQGVVALSGSGCWDTTCSKCGKRMEIPLLEQDFAGETAGTRAVVSEVLTGWARAVRSPRQHEPGAQCTAEPRLGAASRGHGSQATGAL